MDYALLQFHKGEPLSGQSALAISVEVRHSRGAVDMLQFLAFAEELYGQEGAPGETAWQRRERLLARQLQLRHDAVEHIASRPEDYLHNIEAVTHTTFTQYLDAMRRSFADSGSWGDAFIIRVGDQALMLTYVVPGTCVQNFGNSGLRLVAHRHTTV